MAGGYSSRSRQLHGASAGKLRSRVSLKAATVVETASGGQRTTWAPTVEVWARVRALSGSEGLLLGQVAGQVFYEVTIRYREGVAPTSRLLWDGKVLEVTAVLPDDQRQWLVLMARQERVGVTG